MGDFLKGLGASIGYGADPNSSNDLEAYKRQAMGNAQYDELAKSRGFKSGDEMVQFYRNRGNATGGTVGAPAAGSAADFARSKGGAMMHPKNLFEYIGRAFQQATNGD